MLGFAATANTVHTAAYSNRLFPSRFCNSHKPSFSSEKASILFRIPSLLYRANNTNSVKTMAQSETLSTSQTETVFDSSVSGNKQALISLSDKRNLTLLGNGLQGLGYTIVSTGGTASALEEAGISVTKVEQLTSFPEMLDGRVKTLHPSIHGGILARRDQKHHMEALNKHGIGTFDLVVVNLYPFYDKVSSSSGITFEDGIENIDIGGPTMIRAAAKNHKDVLVVVDSEDYPALLEFLNGNQDDQQFRKKLAWKAFQHVASYDSAVSEWLWKQTVGDKFPPSLTVPLSLTSSLRYGENPHQKAAFYVDKSLSEVKAGGIATAIQHHGKEMSYNNYLDADAAWNCVSEFQSPTCVVVKHTNPCGVASRDDILDAYRLAVKADPVSAFGGIVAVNIEVDEALAKEIREFRSPTDGETRMFYEIVVAPKYSKRGLEILRGKSKTLRILEASKNEKGKLSLRQVGGGWLAQDSDDLTPQDITFNVVSENTPKENELRDAEFAWLCAKHVKSNAIVIAKNNCMLGMGSGQPNRRESLRIALKKAGEEVKGAALASDAFFPFAWKDAVEEACESGIGVIAQPGGSMRDGDAIDCCNKYGVSLVFTGNKQALISLSDKRNLTLLGNGLQGLGYTIVSTGGTASALEEAGVSVTKVEQVTSFPEMLDGRVKTLHPSIHGGILARRDQKHHMEALNKHGIGTFDLVVVNLYPFYDKVSSSSGITFEDGIENIDIGGPTMIRAAAKNHKDVLVVVDSEDYPALLEFLNGNQDDQQFRKKLAWKAFQHVASYDSAVSEWLWKQTVGDKFPPSLTVPLSLTSSLRYGENPHQKAAFYVDKSLSEVKAGGIATAIQHHGKEMSYNNYLDADAAWNCVSEFQSPTCVVVKHTNPCGVASRDDILEAYRLAVKADPVSAFGGIVAFNIEVDEALAKEIREFRSPTDGETRMFYEIVVAPKYSKRGLEILRGKSKTLRILEASKNEKGKLSLRQVGGGWLAQDSDDLTPQDITFNVVSENTPKENELRDAEFAWLCAKHVKSNAIVIAKNNCMLGMGSGQPNRRESLRIALKKAGEEVKGAALASDAFFPFAWKDAVEEACESGIGVIAQPGGSMRDGDAIDCCNKYGVSLVFTGVRHFRH